MKNTIKLIGIIALAAAIGLVMAACGDGAGGGGGGGGVPAVQTASSRDTLTGAINRITAPDTAPGVYTVNITGDIADFPGLTLNKAGVKIVLDGSAGNRATLDGGGSTITWKYSESSPNHLRIDDGTLELKNITIKRAADDPYTTPRTLIRVGRNGMTGGSLEIRDGVVITNPNGGGVQMYGGGSVTMTGGTIRDCKRADGADSVGAVTMEQTSVGGSFTMSGGEISGFAGNGVVFGMPSGTAGNDNIVTMTGGTITGNNNGVFFNEYSSACTFIMTGGTISGNNEWGLSVRSRNNGFEKTGGTIYGKTAAVANRNKDGAIRVADLSWTYLKSQENDAMPGTVYAAKLDATGNALDTSKTKGF